MRAGIGNRGMNATNRLLNHSQMPSAEVWALDTDRKALQTAGTPGTILLSPPVRGNPASILVHPINDT